MIYCSIASFFFFQNSPAFNSWPLSWTLACLHSWYPKSLPFLECYPTSSASTRSNIKSLTRDGRVEGEDWAGTQSKVGLCWAFLFSKCKHFEQQVSSFFSLVISQPFNEHKKKKMLHRVSDWFYNEIIILAWSRYERQFPGHKLQWGPEGLGRTQVSSGGPSVMGPLPGRPRWQAMWHDWLLQEQPSDLQAQLFGVFLGRWDKKKKKDWMSFLFFLNKDSMVISLLIIIIQRKKALKCKY